MVFETARETKSQRPLVSRRGHWGRRTGGYKLAALALVGAGFTNRKAINFTKAKVFGANCHSKFTQSLRLLCDVCQWPGGPHLRLPAALLETKLNLTQRRRLSEVD